jgi:thymidylate kinase
MIDNRAATLISFSGMDGAGKSTQIARLVSRLAESGFEVRLVTFWEDVARLKSIREKSSHTLFGGDKGVGSPEKPIERRDKNVRSTSMTCVRFFLYFVDAWSLRRAVKHASASNADVVVFDRYIYDELANLNLRHPISRAYVRLIMSFVPRPHISYILDANPVEARARKPEYPLDFLYTCQEAYLTLSKLIAGLTVIAPMPRDEVTRAITQTAAHHLPAGRTLQPR